MENEDVLDIGRDFSGGNYEILRERLVANAKEFSRNLPRDELRSMEDKAVQTKTTVVAFLTSDGAILAADSRATANLSPALGSFRKLFPILNFASVGISGTAASGQRLALLMEEDIELYERTHQTRSGVAESMSPKSMANRVNIYSRLLPLCMPLFAVFDFTPGKMGVRIFSYDGAGTINEISEGFYGIGSGFERIKGMAAEKSLQIQSMKAEQALPVVVDIMIQASIHDYFSGGNFLVHLLRTEESGGLIYPVLEEVLVRESVWRHRRDSLKLMDDFKRGFLTTRDVRSIRDDHVFIEKHLLEPIAEMERRSRESVAAKPETGSKTDDPNSSSSTDKPDRADQGGGSQ